MRLPSLSLRFPRGGAGLASGSVRTGRLRAEGGSGCSAWTARQRQAGDAPPCTGHQRPGCPAPACGQSSPPTTRLADVASRRVHRPDRQADQHRSALGGLPLPLSQNPGSCWYALRILSSSWAPTSARPPELAPRRALRSAHGFAVAPRSPLCRSRFWRPRRAAGVAADADRLGLSHWPGSRRSRLLEADPASLRRPRRRRTYPSSPASPPVRGGLLLLGSLDIELLEARAREGHIPH